MSLPPNQVDQIATETQHRHGGINSHDLYSGKAAQRVNKDISHFFDNNRGIQTAYNQQRQKAGTKVPILQSKSVTAM